VEGLRVEDFHVLVLGRRTIQIRRPLPQLMGRQYSLDGKAGACTPSVRRAEKESGPSRRGEL